MTRKTLFVRHRTSALCALLLTAGCAQAETGPYYFGVRETAIHDSNVDRTPTAVSDWILSSGVFAGIDQPIGRQHLTGSLDASWNRYRHTERLNHTEGSGRLRLDWSTVGDLAGDLQAEQDQSLYHDFSLASDASQKVVVRSTTAQFNAHLGIVSRWRLEAGIFASRSRYGNDNFRSNDLDYDTYRAGIRYVPSDLLSIGLGARRTNGDHPHAVGASGEQSRSDFDRTDIDLSSTWNPTATSTLAARISRTRLDYKDVSARTNSFTTGALTYGWHPGGRLSLETSLTRDDKTSQYGFNSITVVSGLGNFLSNNLSVDTRIATTAALALSYDLTSKIKLALDLSRMDRKLDNALTQITLGLPTTTFRVTNDRTNSLGLTATYDPTRSVRLSCGFTRTQRSVDDNASGLTYPYADNLVSCAAQLAVQP